MEIAASSSLIMADEKNAAATVDQDGANSASIDAPVSTSEVATPAIGSKDVGNPVSAEVLVLPDEAVDDINAELVILENEDTRECTRMCWQFITFYFLHMSLRACAHMGLQLNL